MSEMTQCNYCTLNINFKVVPTPIHQYELTPKGCFNFLAGS